MRLLDANAIVLIVRVSYQYRDITYGAYGSIHVTQSRRGTYYVGLVAANRNCNISLLAVIQGTCCECERMSLILILRYLQCDVRAWYV